MPKSLSFEVADAINLPYADGSFDVVIIANALHVMENPEQALSEINRVLRSNGILIAPNFVGQLQNIFVFVANSSQEYLQWLENHGWKVTFSKLLPSRISLMYVECIRKAGV